MIRKNYNTKLAQRTRRFFQRLCGFEMHQRHFIKARWIISDKKNKRLEKSMPLATLAHCAFNLKRVS